MANDDPKFLTYNKSIIDKLKPYGPPKIKWDAGTEKYQNVSKYYFDGYGIPESIYVKYNDIDAVDKIKTRDENPLMDKWLGELNKSQDKGSFYIKTPALSLENWSENAILPSNKFIGNYIFEQDGKNFDVKKRRYILAKNETVEEKLKKKISDQLPSDDELNEKVATNCAHTIGNLFLDGRQEYESTFGEAVGKVESSSSERITVASMALAGAVAGSVIPGVGTVAGAVIGAGAGFLVSLFSTDDEPKSDVIKKERQVFVSNVKTPEKIYFKKPKVQYHEGIDIYQYCIFRKCFDICFQSGPQKYYDEDLKISKKNKDITVPAEPDVELFNQYGLDGIYGMFNSFPVVSSDIFGWKYKGNDEKVILEDENNLAEAHNSIIGKQIVLTLDDVKKYLCDLFDVAILLLSNDNSVYQEVVDKLFPFVDGGDKDTFQKKFFAQLINTFTNNSTVNDSTYCMPILINSELGNYSTVDRISKILKLSKDKINEFDLSDISFPLLRKTSETKNNITATIDTIFNEYFVFIEGYGYVDDINQDDSDWPWPPVENESELKNQFHSLRVQYFTSLNEYARACGVALSLIFNNSKEHEDAWDYYNSITFNRFVLDHLILSEEDKEMALDIKTEEGPEGEKRERVVLNEFDIRQSVRDITNSIWYLDDYNWSMDRKNLNELGMEITDFQKLRIYEFQPDKQLSFKRLSESLLQAASGAWNTVMGNGPIATAVKSFADLGVTHLANRFSASDVESKNYATNVDWIAELMRGTWVGQYDVPFFGKNFLKADTSAKWNMGNLADSAEFLKNDLTTNVQDIPTWTYDPGKAEPLSTTIYLLNEDVDSIIKNLKFLHSITAGAWWVQTSFIGYRQPNLYRVLCPGRFIMLYASMAISAEMVGKIRRYSQQDAEEMFGKGSESNDFMPFKLYTSAGEGNCNIPEAYKLTLKLQDLTPQVFNVMANFFTNGYGNESTKLYPNIFVKQLDANIGEQIKSNYEQAVSKIF